MYKNDKVQNNKKKNVDLLGRVFMWKPFNINEHNEWKIVTTY